MFHILYGLTQKCLCIILTSGPRLLNTCNVASGNSRRQIEEYNELHKGVLQLQPEDVTLHFHSHLIGQSKSHGYN